MNEQTINANIADCLQYVHHFGFSVVMNVCNGTEKVIPWSGVDWAIFLGISAVILMFVIVMAAFTLMIVQDLF